MSSTGASSKSTAGESKAPTSAECNIFSALEEKDLVPFIDLLETSGALSQEKGPAPSNDPLQTSGRSLQAPGDADNPYSIAKALFSTLQAKRARNGLPSAVAILLARIRAAQLKLLCLLTRREPF